MEGDPTLATLAKEELALMRLTELKRYFPFHNPVRRHPDVAYLGAQGEEVVAREDALVELSYPAIRAVKLGGNLVHLGQTEQAKNRLWCVCIRDERRGISLEDMRLIIGSGVHDIRLVIDSVMVRSEGIFGEDIRRHMRISGLGGNNFVQSSQESGGQVAHPLWRDRRTGESYNLTEVDLGVLLDGDQIILHNMGYQQVRDLYWQRARR